MSVYTKVSFGKLLLSLQNAGRIWIQTGHLKNQETKVNNVFFFFSKKKNYGVECIVIDL